MSKPLVTVLMPVYNGSNYLTESIESVLNQTFSNFELLIINDSSTDNSLEIIKSFDDSRIRLINNNQNLGQSISMNYGLDLAITKYIARIDQDDICLPYRLEKQVNYMEENPNVGVLGCHTNNVNENLEFISHRKRPLTHNQNKWALLTNTCLMHPTAFIRSSIMKNYRYDKAYAPCEDYELWSRLIHITRIEQLKDVLVLVRKHSKNTGTLRSDDRFSKRDKISKRNMKSILDVDNILFFKQYSNHKLTVNKSLINSVLGCLQGIFIYYRFSKRNKVSHSDRMWIRRNMIMSFGDSKLKFIYTFLLL